MLVLRDASGGNARFTLRVRSQRIRIGLRQERRRDKTDGREKIRELTWHDVEKLYPFCRRMYRRGGQNKRDMPLMNRRHFAQVGVAAIAASAMHAQNRGFMPGRCDLLVYGATPAGIAASIAAARLGLFVVIAEPSLHLGGMLTGGICNGDFLTFESAHGLYREFMNRVSVWYRGHYGVASTQELDCHRGASYEPSVATAIVKEMLLEAGVRYWLGQRLAAVNVEEGGKGRRIARVLLADHENGIERETTASAFVDATYEGDLMAMAGCEYRVGREPADETDALPAGGNRIAAPQATEPRAGTGDRQIPCCDLRLCVTDSPPNRIPIAKPDGFQRAAFLPLLEWMHSTDVATEPARVFDFRRIPNGKAELRDIGQCPVELSLPDESAEWLKGDAASRPQIIERRKEQILGLVWFLQQDPEVPTAIREQLGRWGLAKDEFSGSAHLPPTLYWRDGRRLKGDFVLTAKDTQPTPGGVRAPRHKDAVAVSDYPLNSHGVHPPELRPPDVEAAFNVSVLPYQIPYRVMLPEKLQNLLVPVAVSASHTVYSSLSMEPTWTALGQAAGIAAAQMVHRKIAAQEVDVAKLQDTLHDANAITVYLSDILPGSPYFRAAQYFGTLGFFGNLPEYRNAARGESPKPLMGQWREAYVQHALSPAGMMTGELAGQWAKLAGLDEVPPFHGSTRGDYLNALYLLRHT